MPCMPFEDPGGPELPPIVRMCALRARHGLDACSLETSLMRRILIDLAFILATPTSMSLHWGNKRLIR